MDLIVSQFTSVYDDDLPFHVERFSKNAVGLIVYMTEYLIAGGGQERVRHEISSDVVF
jgi:hypothetical protein